MASVVCCEGFETITGEQSELGEVGTTLTGSFNGASDINVSVVSLDNGISTVAKKYFLCFSVICGQASFPD